MPTLQSEHADSVLVCDHDDEGSHLRRLDLQRLKTWLEKYSLGEIWLMGDFNVLLVDAEAPVSTTPCQHLKLRDDWALSNIDDEHCHMMVQTMEAWLIADIEALKKFYGQGFKENAIPKNPEVEKIDKKQLELVASVALKSILPLNFNLKSFFISDSKFRYGRLKSFLSIKSVLA